MATFIRLILRWRAVVLATIVLLLGLSAFSARRIRLQFQFRDFYDYPANRELPAFKRANDDFGDPAGNVVLLLRARDVFQPAVLRYIKNVSNALAPNPLFAHINSLSTARAIRGHGDEVVTGAVLGEIPDDPGQIAALRASVLQDPLLLHRLVSPDGKVAAVLAEMRRPAAFATVDEQATALAAVKQVLAQSPPPEGVTAVVTGAPAVEVETTRALIADQMRLMPGVMAVLLLALFLTFRSHHGILLALASVNIALVWTAGFYATLGRPLDMIGSVIPTTILVYGVVDPIFVLSRFLAKLDAGKSKTDAIVESFSELALPCFLTSVTTGVGFLAFITASAPSIQYFGLAVGIGVLLSWVTTMTVLPVLLSFMAAPKRRFESLRTSQLLDRLLHRAFVATRARAPLVLGLTALTLVGGALLAREQHIVNVYIDALPHGDVQNEARGLERDLTGVLRFVVYLEGEPDSMRRPEVLAAIAEIDAKMEAAPQVTYSVSLADVVAQAHQAFSGGDPGARKVPASRPLVAQYLALLDPQDRSAIVSDDYARSQIAILVRDEGSEAARALSDKLSGIVAASGINRLGVRTSLTGNGVVAYQATDKVVVELVYGFAVAFAIVCLFQWVMFRSLRIAIISVVPNLIPIVLCFLALRFLRLPLRLDTSLVLCVSIGGLFNTTIHLAARIRQHRQGTAALSPDRIIDASLRTIGPSAIFTSAILSGGFAVLALSSFPGLRALGLLSMVTLLSAVACDVLISPVLFRLFLSWKQPNATRTTAHSYDLRPTRGDTRQT